MSGHGRWVMAAALGAALAASTLAAAPASAQPDADAAREATQRRALIVLPDRAIPHRQDFGLTAVTLTSTSVLAFLFLLRIAMRRRKRVSRPDLLTRAWRAARDISRLARRLGPGLRQTGRTAGRLVQIAGRLEEEAAAAGEAARRIPRLGRRPARRERARLLAAEHQARARLLAVVDRLEETATNLEYWSTGMARVADLEGLLAELDPTASRRAAPDLRLIA